MPVDKYAKRALGPDVKNSIRNKQMIPHLPAQQISFHNQFHRLTRNTFQNLNRYKIGHKAEKYILNKRSLSQKHKNLILWSDFERVLLDSSITKRTQYIKNIPWVVADHDQKSKLATKYDQHMSLLPENKGDCGACFPMSRSLSMNMLLHSNT